MIRFAVIGAGHLGSIHISLLPTHDNVQVACVVDPDEQRGRAVAEGVGAVWVPRVDAMPAVDAVVIAAPTTYHHELATHCLLRGIHTFIEKPVTATYAQATELMNLAAQSGCIVQVGHIERFNPALTALADFALKPLFIEGHRLSTFKPRAIDVSVVQDLMIHDIDLLLWMTKSTVTDIQATGVAVLTQTPDIANARLTFQNGCVANLTASRISAKPMRKLRLFQNESYISIDLAQSTAEMFRLIDQSDLNPGRQISLGNITTQFGNKVIVLETPVVQPANAIAQEQASFLRSITTNGSSAVTVEEAAEAVRIAEQIESAMAATAPHIS